MTYTSPSQDQSMYPSVTKGSEEWDSEYKIRVVVEKNIQYFKDLWPAVILKQETIEQLKPIYYLQVLPNN